MFSFKYAFTLHRGNEQPLHSEKFIANDEEVKEHMKLVYAKMGNQVCLQVLSTKGLFQVVRNSLYLLK